MLFHPLSPHLLPRGSLYACFIYLCVGSLQKGATTERRGFSTGQKTLDGYPSWHWEWPPSVLRGSHQRPLPEIASLQCLWQYTHDLIRTENKRRKEEKRREDSLLNCPSAGNADGVDANTLSPEERQIHLHRQALVTSQTPSPTRSSWSDVSLPLWLTLAHTGLQSMHTQTHTVPKRTPGRSERQQHTLYEHGWVTVMSLSTTTQLKARIIACMERMRLLCCQGGWRI